MVKPSEVSVYSHAKPQPEPAKPDKPDRPGKPADPASRKLQRGAAEVITPEAAKPHRWPAKPTGRPPPTGAVLAPAHAGTVTVMPPTVGGAAENE